MQLVLFWVFAVLMLVFGAAVVFLRNPVSSALSLVMSFVFLAALFVTLDAFFIGVVLVVFGFIGLLGKVLSSEPRFHMEKPLISNPQISDVAAVGVTLFRYFNPPFQIIGVLLLVATVGVVILSKKELK